jgi:putative transposase
LVHGIGTLIIGKNEGWKQQIKIGKQNNQQFVNIPHARLIEMLTYKAELVGIKGIHEDKLPLAHAKLPSIAEPSVLQVRPNSPGIPRGGFFHGR